MMSDERRRRRSPESSRRSRRKARRDEREHPDTTLYSYPSQAQAQAQSQSQTHAQSQWASSSYQQTAESPLPPITMRTNDDARAIPIPSERNRPQRRRRSRHGSGSSSEFTYSSSGSSSSSYLDISRWYPSFGRAGGVLNAFFKTPSEHRPRRRRSRKLVKTKKTKAVFGFGNNSSSSSVNSDMAYGMGFIRKPKSRGGEFSPGYQTAAAASTGREALDARPGLPRRQTDEEILEIGRKLAQVAKEQNQEDLRRLGKKPPSQFAATMSSWDRYRQSTSGQSISGRGIAPSRSDHRHGYSSDDESEWESASEDEDSDGSSGLAYGLHHVSTPKPSAGRTSRPSTVIASASPEERRVLERKSSIVDPKLFGPVNSLRDFVNTPCGFDEDRGTYAVAGHGQERHTGSAGTAESASAEARPLQTVYPIGTSDPGKMDAARDSGSIVTIQQNNYSTAALRDRVYSTPNDRPDPVPIQAPKPIAPVPSRLYEDQRVHDHERSDSRERRQRSSDYRGERSDSRDRRHVPDDYETGRFGSRERRRNPGDSKIFAETALVGAGVAALGAAIMSNRDKGKGKDPESNYGRDERYGHKDHRQDDTKVQDSRRAKELALEREIERLEKALAGRNKARETRKRESKRNSAPADLEKDYERERERRRGGRSFRPSDTDGDTQPEASTRVDEPRGQAATVHDTNYHRVGDARQPEPKGNMNVFQYQVSDDEFKTGTTPPKAPLPVIIDITPGPSPAPDEGRKSRRDSFEDEIHDARHIVEEASHSTAPIPEVTMAAAIAATEHSRRHEELEDEKRGRAASRTDRDRVQEEANRYYHARRIAEREIRSRSRSGSPDRDGKPPRIVTPPEMKERPKVYDYSKPNADIIFDNELSPTELRSFLPREIPVRDPSAERPRPVLNLVLPTPVPTPSPEKEEKRREPASRASEVVEEESSRESPTVIIGPKGEIVQIVDAPGPREEVPQPPTPKSVSWGPSETKQYEVDSPERSRERTPESPDRKSRSGKKSSGGWGTIAAALAGATAGAAIAREDDGKRSEGSRSPPKERPILPAGTSSRVMEEEPEELPPLPGPKPASPRSSQMPGAFADDLEFTANVAAGLQHAGFPSDIVVEDPNFRRRDSPPGSNEPFMGEYRQPFSETVSDLGILGLDDGSRPVREPGYILGEVAETPASEKADAFDESNFESTSVEAPKLSKKEQRKLDKTAKTAKLAGEERQVERPIEDAQDEWAEASTSKKNKKSKKSKRSSVSWDDEDMPANDTYVSAPLETLDDPQEIKSLNQEDDWDVPKRSKKSKRNSKGYDVASEDSPDRRERRRDAYEPLDRDVASVVSDSRYDDLSNGRGRDDDRSVVSAPSSSDRRQDNKSEKRSSSGFWGLLKGSNGVDTNEKKESKKDNAGTLGAGAGLAGAAVVATALAGGMAVARSDAAEALSGQEEPHVGRDVDQSARRADSPSREVDVFEDLEIMPRVIKPAIDPQYGDLLPLPPSPGEKSSLDLESNEDLPALPDSRPATPPGQERALPRERSSNSQKRPGLTSHSRRTSTYETPLRSPSHTAVPIQFRMGHRPASTVSPASGRPAGSGSPSVGRSSPTSQSPATSSGQEFSPTFKRTPRPTSWDSSKEFKPLYLLEQAGRSTRDSEVGLGDWPETTPLPPSRESPVPEIGPETLEHEVVSGIEDVPTHTKAEATRAVPFESQESTPKGTPAAEYSLPPSAGIVELTPYETPVEAPFGIASAGSLPESSYATPVESPSQVIKEPNASGRQEVEQSADVFDSGLPDSRQDLQVSPPPQNTVPEGRQPQEVAEAQNRKSYFPSAFSILPAATLAGVGALLGRGKYDEAASEPSEHTTMVDAEEQTEDLPALADQVNVKSARETDLGDQGGSTEQGAVSAHKSSTDTIYSSNVNIADAYVSVPNDPAAAVPMYSEESLSVDESRPVDTVPHEAVDVGGKSHIAAVAETSHTLLPSSLPRDTETDLTTPAETDKITEDMETIIETPTDTIDWPMETAPKKKGKKGKKKQSISHAPQAPMDARSSENAPFEALEDAHVPEMQASKAADEPILAAEPAITSDILEAEAEPAQVASISDVIGANVTEPKDFGEVTGPSYPAESTDKQGLVNDPEELQAPVDTPASLTMQDEQGVIARDRPLKSSSGRRLRSSRVMSPHGSVDEYMSSDAIQSGEDAPASPSSGLRTTGKKYKKTRSLRSSRRSSAASQGSGQDKVTAEQPASEDIGTSATTVVPDVEQFRDTTDEPLSPAPKVDSLPADAQANDVEQFLSKETEHVEEPIVREPGVDLEPFQIETEAVAEGAPATLIEAQPLQYEEVVAEPASLPEAQADDDWAPTSSRKGKKNKKKKKTQSISLAEDSWDTPAPEATAEKAVPDALEPIAPQESTLITPGDYDQALDVASDHFVGEEHSQSQAEPVEINAPLGSEKLAEDELQPQSQAETTAEESTVLPRDIQEQQDSLRPLEDEPALAKEETLEEQSTIQPTVDEPPTTGSEDLPSAQEVAPEPTPVSLEDEFPVISKKSKKNKKKRKSSTVLDEAIQFSGPATPTEPEQADQDAKVQETSTLPVQEEVLPPTSDSLLDTTAAKEESQSIKASGMSQVEDSLPVASEEATERFADAPAIQEQSDLQQNLETSKVPQEPELGLRSAEVNASRDDTKPSEPATDQPDVFESSVQTEPETAEKEVVRDPVMESQLAELGAAENEPEFLDSVPDQANAVETGQTFEPETARDEVNQPIEPIEPTEAYVVAVPEEASAEDTLRERLEETEAPAHEESQKEIGEEILRREAEAALAEEEEAEIVKLQGKKKLKAKEKQRLRELKERSEARAAEAETIAMTSAEEKAPVESTLEAEVTETPSNEQDFPVESSPEVDIGGPSTAEVAVDGYPTETIAPVSAPEKTTPIATKESLAIDRDGPESATSTAQQPGLVSDSPLGEASTPIPDQKAEMGSGADPTMQASEDPEEIARREAEAEVIRREESELARLKNKKKLNKKDKERMRVLRASAELRELEAEALQRQIEEQEAAAVAQEALDSTPVEAEAESSKESAAIETSEAATVEDIGLALLEENTKPEAETSALSQPEEQLPRDLEKTGQEQVDTPIDLHPEDKLVAETESTSQPEIDMSTQLQREGHIPVDGLESVGQESVDVYTNPLTEGKVAMDMEDTTKEAMLNEPDVHTITDSIYAPRAVAEESIPLPEYATGDVRDRSLHEQPEGRDSKDAAIQETADLPKLAPEQDQSHLPNYLAESLVQQNREAEIVQGDAPQPLPQEPIGLPEHQSGEAREVGDRSETEIVAEPDHLPLSEPDNGQALPGRGTEQSKEEVIQSRVGEAADLSLEPQIEELGSGPLSEVIPTSEVLDREAHMVIPEEATAMAEVEPEPEPVFTTKKSKKDKKKKRKGTISETSGQTSGVVTPTEANEPVTNTEALTGETVLQSANDESSPPVDQGIAPSQQTETAPSEQLETIILPSVSNEESPLPLEDETIGSSQEAHVRLSEEQATLVPAAVEHEALPIAAPELEQEASSKEPEFSVSTKKSKKDKKKNRKGTISGSSPPASGHVTPADIDNPQEETLKVLERSENPALTVEPESVPTIASDVPQQEQFLAREEPSTIQSEVEAAAPVKESDDAKVDELRELDSGDHQMSVPTEDVSLLPEHEQQDNTARAAENVFLNEPQSPEQEQAKSPTIAEESSLGGLSTVVEPEAVESKDVTVQAGGISADPNPQGESLPLTAIEPEEVQADEFFVVPTKKNKKDKKKKRASVAWMDPAESAETPVVEDPTEPVSIETTEATTDFQEVPTASPDIPLDESTRDSQAPLDDWAPATSSKKRKKDKKKKRASASLWEPESGTQTLLAEEPQDLQDTPEPMTETVKLKNTDLTMQPTETLQEPETSSPGELTHTQDTAILPVADEENREKPSEEPTTIVKPDSTTSKSSGGWGLIAAAIGGENSEPKENDHSILPVEPLEPEPETTIPRQENFGIDDALVTAEGREKEPQSDIKSFNDPKASATKSMSGWGTIAAAVAGVTAGAAASSAHKSHHETDSQHTLEDAASVSEPVAKPDIERRTDDVDDTVTVASGERVVTHDDPVSAPISKPDLEDKVKDGEETLIVAGGKTNLDDTEPWTFEAARDVQAEPITKSDLDEKVDNGDDTIIVAGGRILEEPTQGPQNDDTREIVAEQTNHSLDVDRTAIRPSSPVPLGDVDHADEFATPSEQPPVLGEEAEPMSTFTATQTELEPLSFTTGKKSKKDKRKKKRGSVSQSLDLESEMPTPVEETPQFEEAPEQPLPSASVENPMPAEPVDSDETKPADGEALDWIPKKMSKKEKRKAEKGSLSFSEPDPLVTTPGDGEHLADVVASPQNLSEGADRLSSPQDNRAAQVDEDQQGSPLTKEPKTLDEPSDVGKEGSLDAETSSAQQQPESPAQKQSEDIVVKYPITEPVIDPSMEPESTTKDEVVLETVPPLARKMSKKEKRKAKKQATSSWEDDVVDPGEPPVMATDPQNLDVPDPTPQPDIMRNEALGVPSLITTQPVEAGSGEPEAPTAEEIVAEDEWAPLSGKKSKKDKKKKGKQRASESASGSQTPITDEQPTSVLPQTSETNPSQPPVSETLEPSTEDQRHPVEDYQELATEPQVPPISIEHEHTVSSAEKEQPQPSTGAGIDDWEEPSDRAEPAQIKLGSPATLGAELQKMPSAAPSPDIWDDDDYFKPRQLNESRNSPNEKPVEKVDIHPAFSRELRASPENKSQDERPLVGLGLIRRHSSIFQDDDGHVPKLLTLGADSFSVEPSAVEETGSPDDYAQKPRGGKSLLEQHATPAPEDNGDSSSNIQMSTSPESNAFAVQYAIIPEPDDHQPTSTDPVTPRTPKPPPSPGLDDVNKMSKKGSVAMLAERFGGTTKKVTGKNKKVSRYVDKRTPEDDLFDEPAMWEGSERKPVEGSSLDQDAGDFWAVPDTDFDEASVEPDTLVGQGATTSHGQDLKTGDDNVSATHSPTSQEAGEFTAHVPEQASRAEEVPLESLVVESPVLGSQASFELSPREEQVAIEPLDRPPDIDTGQTAHLPTITTELTHDEPGKEVHSLHTPRSLSPASDRGARLDRTVSPAGEADDYAFQQGISPVSDLRRSISRGLPPVQEEPQEEEGDVGKHGSSLNTAAGTPDINRDSGFVTGSPLPPRSRQFDDFQQQRDSGVHLRDYPDTSPRHSSTRGSIADPNRISQSSLDSEGAKLDDKPRRSPLADSPRRRQLGESTPVLEAQETPVTPEPQKSRSPTRRSRKHYPDLGPETAAASLAGGAALLSGAGSGVGRGATSPTPSLSSAASRRSISDQPEKRQLSGSSQPDTSSGQRRAASNTGIFRAKTPEPLNLRSESPSLLRYSGTPPLRSRRTRSGDLRSLSQLSNRSHSDVSALLQASPSPVSGAVDPAGPANTPGPASSSSSSDLRRPTTTPATAQAPHQKSNNNNHTPLANEGRVRSKDMADVYDGFGEGRLGSPRSPTRPHSMRRRQSMQVLELESRVEQLIAENRALSEARLHAEQHSTNRATSTIAERDNEIDSLKQSLDFMRKEIQRLTEVNEGLNSAIAQSAVQHEDRYRILETQHADATRELDVFRGHHSSSSKTIEEKDAEIRDLREQLEATKEQIRDMQRQILASKPADSDFLRIKDVDYFDHRCQQLCSHVQQWVLRFSKFSDMRACRLTSELNDEKIIDRLDNAVLDGSNVDNYLNDRVRRRDIFMSLAMTMIWEFVFTRYLFGMDREQRQKLKALEKLLLEVGPPHAVRQWRAVTLTLLSRRESFNAQRDQDTEAVVQAVFQTLCMILPPPSNLEDQIQNQLRKVMREAVDLSVEMRTQRAEYMMLPPLQPEYDANGDLAEPHPFNATLMNERSGDKSVDNDDLQAQGSIVRVVLFPLVVKKGDDDGVGDDEVVVCPAQVIVARPRSSSRRSMRAPSSDAGGVSLLRGGSPSSAPNRSNVSMAEAEYLEGGI